MGQGKLLAIYYINVRGRTHHVTLRNGALYASSYRKYITKITNPNTKPQLLTFIKLTYTGIKKADKNIGCHATFFSVQHLNQL